MLAVAEQRVDQARRQAARLRARGIDPALPEQEVAEWSPAVERLRVVLAGVR